MKTLWCLMIAVFFGWLAVYAYRQQPVEPVAILHIEQPLAIAEPVILHPVAPRPDVRKFALAESGGNPHARNRNSTASGAYQFTDHAWRLCWARWGKSLHIRLRDKNKPLAQRLMAQKLADDNARILAPRIGRQPTELDLYIAHFLGAHDAERLLTAKPGVKAVNLYSQSVVDANRGIFFDGKRARTVKQVCQLLNDKIA